jgi:hypothetical protein
MFSAWTRDAATSFARRVLLALSPLWAKQWLFFCALTVFNLFLSRRTFQSGIWADNDSVCHYAYLRHLVEDFFPATGTYIGWTPKYDLGAPFLLYNTPPGVCVCAAVIAKLTGLSPLLSLKLLMVSAYVALPLVGAYLAATFEERPGDLPKFVGLALSLFSSELFGLEFFFKNGMLNPALALPFALASLVFLRFAQRAQGPRGLVWLALGGGAFAVTAFVHLLTTYMLTITLGCFALAEGPRALGRGLVRAGVIIALGAGLAAFWLVPSMAFAPKEDAAYTWIRRPADTISSFLDGSMLSSYFVGFYPRFFEYSPIGLLATVCAGVGIWQATLRRNWAVLACALCMFVSLLFCLGPSPSFGLWVLPMYGHLLWYRFATLLELTTLLLAGFGAWRLWGARARLGNIVVVGLVGGALWAGLVMTKRAVHVKTAQDFPEFIDDVDVVSQWLREHGKRGGRVFSEFLGQNVVDSASVNYPRHMVPVLSGFSEAGGWVYENDEAAQFEMRRGLFWYDPFPMIALAQRYDVQYIVAGSPNFVHMLMEDPRWKRVVATPHVSLFEAVGREPSLLDAPGWDARLESERYLRGGGYEYVIRAAPRDGAPSSSILVKTSWSSAWRARSGDHDIPLTKTEDGLLEIAPPATPSTITLTWDIGGLRSTGNRISLGALALGILMVLLGLRADLPGWKQVPPRVVEILGVGGAALALVGFAIRAKPPDLKVVGFGVREGLETTYDMRRLAVGSFDDDQDFRLTRLDPPAWGPRTLSGGHPARALVAPSLAAATVVLAPTGENRITVSGQLEDSARSSVVLTLRPPHALPTGMPSCRLEVALGQAARVPDTCLSGPRGEGPGIERNMEFEAGPPLTVTDIDVQSDIVLFEAEAMHNVVDDGGYDAFYSFGPPDLYASNGVSMVANAGYDKPIALDREVSLPAGDFELWLLTRTVSARLQKGRAHFLVEADAQTVADLDVHTRRDLPFWDDKPHSEWLPAGHVQGGGRRTIRVSFYKAEGAFDAVGDLDAVALVPTGGH